VLTNTLGCVHEAARTANRRAAVKSLHHLEFSTATYQRSGPIDSQQQWVTPSSRVPNTRRKYLHVYYERRTSRRQSRNQPTTNLNHRHVTREKYVPHDWRDCDWVEVLAIGWSLYSSSDFEVRWSVNWAKCNSKTLLLLSNSTWWGLRVHEFWSLNFGWATFKLCRKASWITIYNEFFCPHNAIVMSIPKSPTSCLDVGSITRPRERC